jgi:hypothetical protein
VARFRSSKSSSPSLGRSRAPRSWSSVVFPEPLGPTRATNSPASIASYTSETARTTAGPSVKNRETFRSS